MTDVSLAEARERAEELRRALRQGIDPLDNARSGKVHALGAAGASVTFSQCAEQYISAHCTEWKPKHLQQWRASLRDHASVIGDMLVGDIDTAAVQKVLAPMWATIPEAASRLRGRIETVLDSARVLGYRTGDNPARWRGHLDKLFSPPSKVRKVEHHAAMPYAAIPEFMTALRVYECVAARALEFCILTAARTGEVLGARREEFDLDNAIWTIPAERMKAGVEHRVPLSSRAVQIIKTALGAGTEIVFQRSGKPLSHVALRMVMSQMQVADATPHGFRSTFRDWTAEQTTVQNEVCEMALAHAVGDKVEAAYRRGDLFEKRRDLMNAWARFCTSTDAAVVPLPAARRG